MNTEIPSQPVGRVGCPPGQEANVDEFYFWVAPDALVEQTQIVRVDTRMGHKQVVLYGVVEQVYRRSAISSMHMEVAAHNADPVDDDLILERAGVTYAKARVITADPPVLAPPVEGSTVCTCTGAEAEHAYEMAAYRDERGVCVGLIRNGGDATAGRAFLDQDFLLGAQAGHLNVNGAAGAGTKSSFLTLATAQTLRAVQERAVRMRGTGEAPRVKAIIFNVKGFDLFWLDRWSSRFTEDDLHVWQEMGVERPDVFRSIAYYAPETAERSGAARPIATGRPGTVRPYSWSLKDIVDFGLFDLLFSEETRANENLVALIDKLRHQLSTSRERAARTASARTASAHAEQPPSRWSLYERLGVDPPDGPPPAGPPPANDAPAPDPDARRRLTDALQDAFNAANTLNGGEPVRTFQDLLDFLESHARLDAGEFSETELSQMSRSTIQALWRRLQRALGHRSGLLRRHEPEGVPLNLALADEDVTVIDLQSIPDTHLQRFVIAAALNQLVQWRTGEHAAKHETFLVVIDELNRYAPRGASDPITRLFEYVAGQMRSRGIILFGAQQQGSRVSDVVIENSQTRVLGRSGGQELTDPIWRGFSDGDRKLALRLGPGEKVVVAPNFREALHLKVPRPPWAMRPEEASDHPPAFMVDAQPAPGVESTKATVSPIARRVQASLEV